MLEPLLEPAKIFLDDDKFRHRVTFGQFSLKLVEAPGGFIASYEVQLHNNRIYWVYVEKDDRGISSICTLVDCNEVGKTVTTSVDKLDRTLRIIATYPPLPNRRDHVVTKLPTTLEPNREVFEAVGFQFVETPDCPIPSYGIVGLPRGWYLESDQHTFLGRIYDPKRRLRVLVNIGSIDPKMVFIGASGTSTFTDSEVHTILLPSSQLN